MKRTKANDPKGANFTARKVRDIVQPAKSISNKVSVKVALDEMQARKIDSSPVTDERGELLGTVSKNKMNRTVGGMGHDPKTEPVEAHIEEKSAYCFEEQTIAEATDELRTPPTLSLGHWTLLSSVAASEANGEIA